MTTGEAVSETRETVLLEREEGVAWVTLNRPEKRNAMNPRMHFEMLGVLDELEVDDEVRVVVLTGAGESWCAGQDLNEFFRELEAGPQSVRQQVWRVSSEWRWHRLNKFPKPTIAMVNGYCFGGGFTQLVACDFAIAAEDAVFGVSEINLGIFPGGLVSRALGEVMPLRDAMYYIMTGETFDGRKAAELRVVNYAVPRANLREATLDLARRLKDKHPGVLRAAKEVHKTCMEMDFERADEYMNSKSMALRQMTSAYKDGMGLFLDDKRYRPGLGSYGAAGAD